MLYRRILPGGDEGSGVTKQAYSTTILPAALLLGLSIIFGNKAFLYLNVPSIQMIKVSRLGDLSCLGDLEKID